MDGRPNAETDAGGDLGAPGMPTADASVDCCRVPSGPISPPSLLAMEGAVRRISDRASDLAIEATRKAHEGVVKAEFYYRHGRRLAGFGTKGSAVATALAAAAVGYGIGVLIHG